MSESAPYDFRGNSVNEERKANAVVTAGILSLFIISYGVSYIQVIISELASAFPDIPVSSLSYIMAIAPLGGIVGALGAGALARRRLVGYKNLAIIGTLLFLVGGAIPCFEHRNFWFILVCRFFLGIGMGSMSVIANPLVNAFYEGPVRAKILSAGAAIAQIGAMAMQLFAGILGDINVWYAFLADGLAVLSVIGAVFLIKEPPAEAFADEEEGERGRLPGSIWYAVVVLAINTLALCPLLYGVSFFAARFTSSITMTATFQMAYTIAAALGGASYAFMFKAFKRRVLGVSCFIAALGIALVAFAPNLVVMYMGEIVTALGYGLNMPAVMQIAGVSVKPRLVAFATSVIMMGMHLMAFVTVPFMNIVEAITGDGVYAPCYVGIVMFLVMGVLTFVFSPYPKDVMARLGGTN